MGVKTTFLHLYFLSRSFTPQNFFCNPQSISYFSICGNPITCVCYNFILKTDGIISNRLSHRHSGSNTYAVIFALPHTSTHTASSIVLGGTIETNTPVHMAFHIRSSRHLQSCLRIQLHVHYNLCPQRLVAQQSLPLCMAYKQLVSLLSRKRAYSLATLRLICMQNSLQRGSRLVIARGRGSENGDQQ